MAGYSETPLAKKLGIKEDFRITLVNAPKGFRNQLGELPRNVQIVARLLKPLDVIVLFAAAEKTLSKDFQSLSRKLSTNGMIWICWPKKSSGVPTDLSFERVQRVGLESGLVDVKICAVDDTWSGLKFVYRLKDRSALV
jgi:hypothetical protein